jgi:hypothetical protein
LRLVGSFSHQTPIHYSVRRKTQRLFEVPIALITFIDERGLRFYAGVPLRSNNLPIGSLCVLDVKPRPMTERKNACWKFIYEDVMEEIKRRDSVGPPSVLVA